MEITKFKNLLIRGYDVEFNIDDIFYSFTSSEIEGKKIFYIGNEKHTINSSFNSVDELINFKINGITLKEIVQKTPEDKIFY